MAKAKQAAKAPAKRERTEYTNDKRAEVLAVAAKERLTAAAVQKRFGVKPVTYYSWRKKTGLAQRRGGPRMMLAAGSGDLSGQVRSEVRGKMAALLPGIVRSEVASYLGQVFGTEGRRRRRKA